MRGRAWPRGVRSAGELSHLRRVASGRTDVGARVRQTASDLADDGRDDGL